MLVVLVHGFFPAPLLASSQLFHGHTAQWVKSRLNYIGHQRIV
jgi:hypothetical protein